MPLRIVNIIPRTLSSETNFDSESSIAVNPANPNEIVVSAFTPDIAGFGATVTRGVYFFSTDGGDSWATNAVIPGGTAERPTFDMTVKFGGSSGVLYAGIIRADTSAFNILRKAKFTDPALMQILVSRAAGGDQPWVEATTLQGRDRVYVASNDTSQILVGGATASIDFSLDAATAPAPAGFTTTVRLESRASAARPASFGGGSQDGPCVRVAIHPSGVLYGAFFGWRAIGAATSIITSDIVVVRDDSWAAGAVQFQALNDPPLPPGDSRAGLRVVRSATIAFNASLGTQRVGSNLAIAVDPRDSQRVYLAWCDGLATVASPYTLHLRRSDDGGAHWTPDLLTKANATNPGLAVNSRGTVGLLFQEFATVGGTDRWQTHLLQSIDRFTSTFSDSILADVVDSSSGTTRTVIIGDYANLVAIGKDFYGVFSAQNAPVRANFPSGFPRYLRNFDPVTEKLLGVDGISTIFPSVDPFFFHDEALVPSGRIPQIAVAPLPDRRLELWAGDTGGNLFSTWKWTTDPNADWVPLMDFLGEVGALPAAVSALAVAPLTDRRLELWASTTNGDLFSCWKTTVDPNASWTGWADFLAEAGPLPAGVTALAVAPLPDGRLELWASTANGGLFSCWKTTPDSNATWTGWADFLAEAGALPAAVTALTVSRLPDGRLELWASTADGGLFSSWKTTVDPNAPWTGWADFLAEAGALPATVTALTVAPLPDGRLELWASTADGSLFSCWKTTMDPNAPWTGWADFLAEAGALPAAVTALTVAPLPDRRLELWASTADGRLFSSWKTTNNPDAPWTGWADFLAEV